MAPKTQEDSTAFITTCAIILRRQEPPIAIAATQFTPTASSISIHNSLVVVGRMMMDGACPSSVRAVR